MRDASTHTHQAKHWMILLSIHSSNKRRIAMAHSLISRRLSLSSILLTSTALRQTQGFTTRARTTTLIPSLVQSFPFLPDSSSSRRFLSVPKTICRMLPFRTIPMILCPRFLRLPSRLPTFKRVVLYHQPN